MKKQISAFCILSAIALSLSACAEKADTEISAENTEAAVSTDDTFIVTEEAETMIPTEKETTAQASAETSAEESEAAEAPLCGGYDYTFSKKYVDEVYNIYLTSEIVGDEARDEWVNNVYLVKTPDEQVYLPPIYQMIVDLNISRESFEKENEKYIDYPDMYFSKEVISALYQEDVNEMKRQLASPYALYYDGEIYTFDELLQDTQVGANIPTETMSEYIDYIESVCEENGILKYMQKDIDSVRSAYIIDPYKLLDDIDLFNKNYKGVSYNRIHTLLGEPEGGLSGFWGDIYFNSDGQSVIIYYDSDGNVDIATSGSWSEPENEPESNPVPEELDTIDDPLLTYETN